MSCQLPPSLSAPPYPLAVRNYDLTWRCAGAGLPVIYLPPLQLPAEPAHPASGGLSLFIRKNVSGFATCILHAISILQGARWGGGGRSRECRVMQSTEEFLVVFVTFLAWSYRLFDFHLNFYQESHSLLLSLTLPNIY